MHMDNVITIVGGGLAGSEAAWQASQRGLSVHLYEMRPNTMTPAHTTGDLAELVCSNSLGSNASGRASGLLKEELRQLGSLVIQAADAHSVPAGSALAVDRAGFAAEVTRQLEEASHVHITREEVTNIPTARPLIIASGPLTSEALAQALQVFIAQETLYFYDAIAPIVEVSSIDFDKAFYGSRYDKGEAAKGDYINCPLTEEDYDRFVTALLAAERVQLRDFEQANASFFEACLPVEVLAARGHDALAYGPLRPVGLRDPRTGHRPHAVIQLRQDNAAGTLYNMVGFQTNLKYGEQKHVFRLIPGLEHAEFVRYGSMHRNTYINAPALLNPTLQLRDQPAIFFAGQIAGLEGYAGNIAGGWLAGVNAARLVQGLEPLTLPPETMIGALMQYITHADVKEFQPMKANFGITPPLKQRIRGKRARGAARAQRALEALAQWKAKVTI